MAVLSLSAFAANKAAFATRKQQQTAQRGRRLQISAMAEEDKKLNFESNKRSALGFTESDSAGQTNIFAVEPKAYVAGSSSDKTSDAGSSTLGAAAVAGTVAVGAVIAGLVLINGSSVSSLDFPSDLNTLSQYSAQFSAELKPVAAAPAVADE